MRAFAIVMTCFVCFASGLPARAAEMGTQFTYQGRLVKNGTPVGDAAPVVCDMTFGLFDAAAGGNQIGLSPVGPMSISVDRGLFNVNLSFGVGAMNGQARWLEITVDCPGDAMPTILAPRQQLRPAPHALALPGLYTIQDAFSPNLIGGKHENAVATGVSGATISGGGAAWPDNNLVTDTFGTIGGGSKNQSGNGTGTVSDAEFATIGGGFYNKATFRYSTVGGGNANQAFGHGAFVGGGIANTAEGPTTTISGGGFNYTEGASNYIGGGQSNLAIEGNGITVTGGFTNEANGEYSTIGGGAFNRSIGISSTVSGGVNNEAISLNTTIAGGSGNMASGSFSSIGGGSTNTANGDRSVISGGEANVTSGLFSMVPGGAQNEAGGDYSFAAGRRAKVRNAAASGDANGDEGTFIWSDANLANFTSTGPNRFLVRASGGTRFLSDSAATVGVELVAGGNSWSMLSDRNAKENFASIDPREVLQRLVDMPVTVWNLKSQTTDIKHIGPMAQDFHAAFGVGETDTHISSSDADGVALAAIQGLHQMVREKDCEIGELKEQAATRDRELEDMKSEISDLKSLVNRLVEKAEGRTK